MGDRGPALKDWTLRPQDPAGERALIADLKLPPPAARLLAARGYASPAAARRLLAPTWDDVHPPAAFRHMAQAVDILMDARARGEVVGIYGDYDVDGISGSAVLDTVLRAAGLRTRVHLPHRQKDGYGLSAEGLLRLEGEGIATVITVDNGTAAVEALTLAQGRGMRVIVTDHHEAGPPDNPAAALINPKAPGETYPFAGICGAGVAFKLAWGLARRLSGDGPVREDLKAALHDALGYVALGTVGDVVPLVDENRILVRLGLRALSARSGRVRPGLRALLDLARLRSPLRASDIAFQLAPRLNAAGRMDSPRMAFDLLTCEDQGAAAGLAQALEGFNRQRRAVERQVLREAERQVDQVVRPGEAIVVAGPWHEGVIGIVAARLVDAHGVPALVVSLDEATGRAKGSGRAVAGVDLLALLTRCASVLERFGGHRAAAGFSLALAQVAALREGFVAAYRELAAATPEGSGLGTIDAELRLSEITPAAVAALETLEPFGQAHPEPLFLARGLRLCGRPRVVGADGRHLALTLGDGATALPAFGFSLAREIPMLEQGPVDALLRPARERLEIKALRPDRGATKIG